MGFRLLSKTVGVRRIDRHSNRFDKSQMRYFKPTSVPMKEHSALAPASEKAGYPNVFEQKDHISEFTQPIDVYTPSHVSDPCDLKESSDDPFKWSGWGEFTSAHYDTIREPTFPRNPDIEKGELVVGASLQRTDVWNRASGDEPAITAIARFSPDNFRPVGYAENAPSPDSCVPEGHFDFTHARLPEGHADRRPFFYFTTCVMHSFLHAFVRGALVKVVHSFWPGRNVLASGKVEVDLSCIQPGDNFTIKWRGKPIFIRRRTEHMIRSAVEDDKLISTMRHPELDSSRVIKPEWLIMIGVCTHLGCVPYPDQGNYGGFFCPCHGSHYDHSGRIRLGPAPKNMEIPPHDFISETKLILGD